MSETFADPSSGDNQLKADFKAGIQALDTDDTTGFRIGAGGEAYLDLLDGALEISLVEGSLWAGYDVEDESGYYEAGLSVFEIDVFDESSNNDVELSMRKLPHIVTPTASPTASWASRSTSIWALVPVLVLRPV